MDINMLNKYTTEIYLGNEKSLDLLLVDIDNIISGSAQIIYPEVKDKILYDVEDIKQEIIMKLWIYLISYKVTFKNFKELNAYIMNIAEEVLEETRG